MRKMLLIGCALVFLFCAKKQSTVETEGLEEVIVFGEEETSYEVSAGQVCYIPPYTLHNNKNIGIEPLVYIYCVAPVKQISVRPRRAITPISWTRCYPKLSDKNSNLSFSG